MDGNYSHTLERRLLACDTAIFLDMPRWLCMWRVLRRIWRNHGQIRADAAPQCPEKFDPAFLGYVWGYRRRSRARVCALLELHRPSVTVYRLSSTRQVADFLQAQ
jgi:adenylate kinase family enzyme